MPKQSFSSGQTLLSSQMNDLQTNDFNQTVSTKTAAYTFVVGDRGTRVVLNDTTARTFTIDDAIFSAGDTIQVHNINTGVLTIAAGAGVTLNGADVLTVAQYQGGTIFFTSASSAIFFPTAKTSGKILQVVSTTKTDTFTMASQTFADVTDLSVSITPTSSSNKVLVLLSITGGNNPAAFQAFVRLVRNSTDIAIADAAGSRISSTVAGSAVSTGAIFSLSANFLDSPATTSATTYKVQIAASQSASTVTVNRSSDDSNGTGTPRTVSTITVLEVAA